MFRVLTFCGFFATLVFIAGCGPTTGKPMTPVSGKIKFADGAPLPRGTRLVFNPSVGISKTATGETSEDGSFKLTHASGKEGAEEGMYSVQLLAPDGDSGEFFKLLPSEYTDGSKLTADIKAGMTPLEFSVPKRTPGKK
jgi:hypothetical protein